MDVKQLLARMAAQREAWATLPNGRRVQFRRPEEVELPLLAGGVLLDHVVRYVCGWEGFTEADLLGAAVGSSDAVEFAPELWEAYVRDNAELIGPVARAMADEVTRYLARRADIAKN